MGVRETGRLGWEEAGAANCIGERNMGMEVVMGREDGRRGEVTLGEGRRGEGILIG